MKKKLIIEYCWDCKYHATPKIPDAWHFNRICKHEKGKDKPIDIKQRGIPNWCLLEDAE